MCFITNGIKKITEIEMYDRCMNPEAIPAKETIKLAIVTTLISPLKPFNFFLFLHNTTIIVNINVEEFLKGIELSVFVLTDGNSYKILPAAKDYKRIGVGDVGLNTGGMGAISPVPFANRP